MKNVKLIIQGNIETLEVNGQTVISKSNGLNTRDWIEVLKELGYNVKVEVK